MIGEAASNGAISGVDGNVVSYAVEDVVFGVWNGRDEVEGDDEEKGEQNDR